MQPTEVQSAQPALVVRPERMCREFEELGLGPAEARVVVALLRLGSAKSTELAKEATVPRTGIYQLIDGLQKKGLVVRVPSGGPAMWTTPGRDKLIDRLHTAVVEAERERVEQHALRATMVRELLAEAMPAPDPVQIPYVHIITCPAQMREGHERLIKSAEQEVVTFNRPPYATDPGRSYQLTCEALNRGVGVRAMYQAAQAEDPEASGFHESAAAYAAAGVTSRVADELPLKLLVVDRSSAIVGLDSPMSLIDGLAVTLLIEHPGFASAMSNLFDTYWTTGRPHLS